MSNLISLRPKNRLSSQIFKNLSISFSHAKTNSPNSLKCTLPRITHSNEHLKAKITIQMISQAIRKMEFRSSSKNSFPCHIQNITSMRKKVKSFLKMVSSCVRQWSKTTKAIPATRKAGQSKKRWPKVCCFWTLS